jgi:hypothetical protein
MQGEPLSVTSAYIRHLFEDDSNPAAVPADAQETPAAPEPAAQTAPAAPASGHDGPWEPLASRPDLIRWGSGEAVVEAVRFGTGAAQTIPVFEYGDDMHLEVRLCAKQDLSLPGLGFAFALRNNKGLDVICYTTYDQGFRFPPLRAGQTFHLRFDWKNILAAGDYALVVAVENVSPGARHYQDYVENAVLFRCVSQWPILSAVAPPIGQTVVHGKLTRVNRTPHGEPSGKAHDNG